MSPEDICAGLVALTGKGNSAATLQCFLESHWPAPLAVMTPVERDRIYHQLEEVLSGEIDTAESTAQLFRMGELPDEGLNFLRSQLATFEYDTKAILRTFITSTLRVHITRIIEETCSAALITPDHTDGDPGPLVFRIKQTQPAASTPPLNHVVLAALNEQAMRIDPTGSWKKRGDCHTEKALRQVVTDTLVDWRERAVPELEDFCQTHLKSQLEEALHKHMAWFRPRRVYRLLLEYIDSMTTKTTRAASGTFHSTMDMALSKFTEIDQSPGSIQAQLKAKRWVTENYTQADTGSSDCTEETLSEIHFLARVMACTERLSIYIHQAFHNSISSMSWEENLARHFAMSVSGLPCDFWQWIANPDPGAGSLAIQEIEEQAGVFKELLFLLQAIRLAEHDPMALPPLDAVVY